MADQDKKITELQLISSIISSQMFPLDNGIQTYRATIAQLYAYIQASLGLSTTGLNNMGIVTSVASNALTIALKTNAGADASSTDKISAVMRSSTLATGLQNLREVTGALSLTISSGSTLGHSTAQNANIFVYLIDNAGTLELAVSQSIFDEKLLVSTIAEGGAGGADLANVMYSASARSNVPFRLIGLLVSNQTTAGTWASNMTSITMGNYGVISDVNNYVGTNNAPTTQGLGTLSNPQVRCYRINKTHLLMEGQWTSGTVTGVAARYGLPLGLTAGSAGGSGTRQYVGELIRVGGTRVTIMAQYGNSYVTFGSGADSHGDVIGTSLLGSSETVYFRCQVPILQWGG